MHRTASQLLILATLGACAGPSVQHATPPNVVLIFVDDLGYADIGAYGATDYATPNLGRMAAEGARFTNFYASQPVCSASRASLLTGVYANRLGLHGALGPGANHGLHPEETTLGELFQAEGYRTAIYGKWHLGHLPEFLPTRHGFDEFYGIPYSNDMWPFHPESPEVWGDLPTLENEAIVGFNTDQSRFTTDFTERAIEFIEQSAGSDEPFFVYLAHPMPHVPLFVSEERSGASGAGLYGDVVAEIDWSVGQVFNALQRLGVDEQTLVVFASDNGPWLSYGDHAGSAGPLREGKGTAFDGGVRVPFLVRWPGTVEPRVIAAPAMTIDVFPTLAETLGAPLPARPIDGATMWPLLSGLSAEAPQNAYAFYYRSNELHAVRSGRWKLVFPHTFRTMEGQAVGAGGIPGKYDYDAEIGLELFDLEADISETANVADDHPDVLERMQQIAERFRNDMGDTLTERDGRGLRAAGQASAESLVGRVRELRLAGHLDAAQDLAEAQLHRAADPVAAQLHIELARIADRFGLHNNRRPVAEAMEHIERAAEFARDGGRRLAADVEMARAQMLYRAEMAGREFTMARRHSVSALAAYQDLDDEHGQAEATHLLGLVAMQRRELVEARRLFDESLRLDQAAGERTFFRGEYERHVAFVELFEDRPATAIPHLQRSLRARRTAGAVDASVFAASTLASTLLDLGRDDEAGPVIEYGVAVSRELDFPRGGAQIELVAGRFYRATGDQVAARAAFERALEHALSANLEGMANSARQALNELQN
ncbi:MAG: sulfatase-like hydrolase/transferase [Acidobacteria bacterium]|nr:sulfatase-like hydrolase/transferase [Acidobacteriota bacterium]